MVWKTTAYSDERVLRRKMKFLKYIQEDYVSTVKVYGSKLSFVDSDSIVKDSPVLGGMIDGWPDGLIKI